MMWALLEDLDIVSAEGRGLWIRMESRLASA
jgi:hypothetical protein